VATKKRALAVVSLQPGHPSAVTQSQLRSPFCRRARSPPPCLSPRLSLSLSLSIALSAFFCWTAAIPIWLKRDTTRSVDNESLLNLRADGRFERTRECRFTERDAYDSSTRHPCRRGLILIPRRNPLRLIEGNASDVD